MYLYLIYFYGIRHRRVEFGVRVYLKARKAQFHVWSYLEEGNCDTVGQRFLQTCRLYRLRPL
jgi:hypothetical protein